MSDECFNDPAPFGPSPLMPEWLILARESRGMSHGQLAGSGVSAPRIREIEHGGPAMTPGEAVKLATFLDYPIAAFLRPRSTDFNVICRKHFSDDEFDLAQEPTLRARLRRMVSDLPACRLRETHDAVSAIYKDEQEVQRSDGLSEPAP